RRRRSSRPRRRGAGSSSGSSSLKDAGGPRRLSEFDDRTAITLDGMLGKDYAGQECALASALEVLGERWTLLIVRDAIFGVRRYSDWVARLDIPRAVLSDRLRGLVAHGILVQREDPERAGRRVYELTDAGAALWPAIHALIAWGAAHRRPSTNRYR